VRPLPPGRGEDLADPAPLSSVSPGAQAGAEPGRHQAPTGIFVMGRPGATCLRHRTGEEPRAQTPRLLKVDSVG
jgi:hypothetical protein